MPSLIVVGKTRTEELPLDGAVSVIGRDMGTFQLSDFKVSRRHALLVQTTEGYFIKDLGSRNGVFLNQKRVPSREQSKLKNGDVLQVGSTQLIFKDVQLAGITGTATRMVEPAAQPPSSAAAQPAKTPVVLARPAPTKAKASPAPPPAAEIPRALPPRSVGGAPPARREDPARPGRDSHAELLLARALDRADRDRAFFRNVCLVLVGLLGATLAWMIAWAVRERPPESTPAVAQAPAPAAPSATGPAPLVAAPARLDRERFLADVHPILAARCASCHSFVGRGGGLVIAASNDPATVGANFAAASRYVLTDRPERSPLLLKPLAEEEGGLPHGGGPALFRSTDPAWQTLRAWASTPAAAAAPSAPTAATPPTAQNRAPKAAIAPLQGPAAVGQPVDLDASSSSDEDGGSLHFRWVLARRPDGSQARLAGGEGPRARFVPDAPGEYEVAVLVHDGSESARATLALRAVLGASDPTREVALVRAWERLTGVQPAAEQKKALLQLDRAGLVQALVERPELYERWWTDELAFLLDGAARPKGEPWDSMPARLREGRVQVQDATYALAVGRDWNGRWQGKQAWVGAVLTRLLGLDPAQAKAERTAAERLYDGYEGEFLGQKGASQADLVRIAVKDARARREALARAWRRATGADPGAALDPALERLAKEPAAFFRVLAEAATRDL